MASLLFLLKFLENFSWCTTQLDNKDKRVLLHEPVNYQIFMIKTKEKGILQRRKMILND
jgi:hypothetical protein